MNETPLYCAATNAATWAISDGVKFLELSCIMSLARAFVTKAVQFEQAPIRRQLGKAIVTSGAFLTGLTRVTGQGQRRPAAAQHHDQYEQQSSGKDGTHDGIPSPAKNDQPHEEVPFSIGLRERNAWIDRDIDPDQQGVAAELLWSAGTADYCAIQSARLSTP
ncbi:MAG: hypothetical protein WCC64_13865 [Aliidongia sp.]